MPRDLVLSARPTVVLEDVAVDLGVTRDQLITRGDAEFARLRTHVDELVHAAKKGARSAAEVGQPAGGTDG